jgi:hypothetical protein
MWTCGSIGSGIRKSPEPPTAIASNGFAFEIILTIKTTVLTVEGNSQPPHAFTSVMAVL